MPQAGVTATYTAGAMACLTGVVTVEGGELWVWRAVFWSGFVFCALMALAGPRIRRGRDRLFGAIEDRWRRHQIEFLMDANRKPHHFKRGSVVTLNRRLAASYVESGIARYTRRLDRWLLRFFA